MDEVPRPGHEDHYFLRRMPVSTQHVDRGLLFSLSLLWRDDGVSGGRGEAGRGSLISERLTRE